VTCTFPANNVLVLELLLLFNGKDGVSAFLIASRRLSWFEASYSADWLLLYIRHVSVSHPGWDIEYREIRFMTFLIPAQPDSETLPQVKHACLISHAFELIIC
jgi:hypothetical protein